MTPEQIAGLMALVDWVSRLGFTGGVVLLSWLIWKRKLVPEWFVIYLLAEIERLTRERDEAIRLARESTGHADRAIGGAEGRPETRR